MFIFFQHHCAAIYTNTLAQTRPLFVVDCCRFVYRYRSSYAALIWIQQHIYYIPCPIRISDEWNLTVILMSGHAGLKHIVHFIYTMYSHTGPCSIICVDLLCYICYTFDYSYYWLYCISIGRRVGFVYLIYAILCS